MVLDKRKLGAPEDKESTLNLCCVLGYMCSGSKVNIFKLQRNVSLENCSLEMKEYLKLRFLLPVPFPSSTTPEMFKGLLCKVKVHSFEKIVL